MIAKIRRQKPPQGGFFMAKTLRDVDPNFKNFRRYNSLINNLKIFRTTKKQPLLNTEQITTTTA